MESRRKEERKKEVKEDRENACTEKVRLGLVTYNQVNDKQENACKAKEKLSLETYNLVNECSMISSMSNLQISLLTDQDCFFLVRLKRYDNFF